jgi:hypothetical protein
MTKSDVQNQFGDPPGIAALHRKSVAGGGLDFMVQQVALPIDRLAANVCFQTAGRLVDRDIEPGIEPMASLATKDQFVEPL